jgi:hypothetical protein
MKKLLLAGALAVVPTVTSAATEWEANSRRCTLDRWYTKGEDAYEFDGDKLLITITPKDIPAIEKGIALLRVCDKFWACIRERDAGKKKRCHIPK